ncbi:MAG: hypothetical protein U1E06_17195 [Tabrizicola sp.]|nr:hypothetical protein [Tabrizicola sp.]
MVDQRRRHTKGWVSFQRGSAALGPGFLFCLAFRCTPCAALTARRLASQLAGQGLLAGLSLAVTSPNQPFLASTVANAVDATTSPLVVRAKAPTF